MLFSFPVERYVVDLGGEYLIDEDGIRRRDAWGVSSHTTRSVAELSPERSLAVLGEPGIGKSTTIRRLVRDDPAVNCVRLDEASDVSVLDGLLAPTVSGRFLGQRKTLVLDGVDECPLATKTLIRRVVTAVSGRSDVRVVVGCRTADWHPSLGDELQSALGSFDVFELLPLSREDIVALANSRGVDGLGFLAAVRGAAAGPLATLPLTLDLLLNVFAQEGGLPPDARELYERGLLILADEPDKDRGVERKPAGSDAQRLAIAARMAGTLMLCGRSAVAVVGPSGDADLHVGGLAGATEPLAAGEFAVTAELVTGTLATALFSGRGQGRFGISHASFAAYLTARYLHAHSVPEHQLRALLTRTSSLGRTSVPTRLRETAAWVVATDPDRNRWLVDLDPGMFVAHSALVADHRIRAALVSHLLDDGDVESTSRRRWRLTHPGLADQLRPALWAPLAEDAEPDFGDPVSRRAHTAIEIARRSGTRDVVPEIAELVACVELHPHLRSAAAHGLAELDPERAAAVLRSVLDEVLEHPERDPYDDLRGAALATCWPTGLTVPDLLKALTGPQHHNYIGSYELFLDNFVEELTEDAVEQLVRAVAAPAAAQPVEADGDWYDEDAVEPGAFLLTGTRRNARLMTALLERALQSPGLEAFVDEAGWLIAECLRRYQPCTLPIRFARDEGCEEDEDVRGLRRALILAAMRHDTAGRAPVAWGWTMPAAAGPGPSGRLRPGLVAGDDLDWLFTLADGPYAEHAATLIRVVFDPTDMSHQEVGWRYRDHPAFAACIGHWFQPVAIASQAATSMREAHQWSVSHPSWVGAESHPAALANAWARCRSGDAASFADLCLRLRTDPRTGHIGPFNDDIATWRSLPLLEVDPDELATAARAYLAAVDVSTGEWLEKVGSIGTNALAGYAGLSLLARRPDAQAWFDGLPHELWVRWAPAITRCPETPSDASQAVRQSLLSQLAVRAPRAFVDAYVALVAQTLAAGWSLPPFEPLAVGYEMEIGDRLSALLPSLLQTINATSLELLTPPPRAEPPAAQGSRANLTTRLSVATCNAGSLAEFLSAHSHGPTIALLETVLGTAESPGSAVPGARAVAAIALVSFGAIAWATVFSLMQSDEGFGRAVACNVARGRGELKPLREVEEVQLGELWAWLNARLSPDPGTFLSGGSFSDDDQLRSWQDDILRSLAERSTPTALSTLAALVDAHPDHGPLRASRHEAETRQRDESWHGPTHEELTALVADARRTMVYDDDALYRLVLLVLDRFAARLENVGQLLWNETRTAGGTGPKVWSPKYEADVCAFLKDHLEQEFAERLVVNREVLVRQTTSRGQGMSLDVLVSGGSSEGATDRMPQCPIEVKGSWNPDLLTDLETQLVDDYLPAVGAVRGVYFCAWFPIDLWNDDGDNRRTKAASLDRCVVTDRLKDAAERVSTSRGVRVAAVVIDVPRPTPSVRMQAKR